MRYGVVLPSYVYDAPRRSLVQAAFNTLAKTVSPVDNKPKMLLILKLTPHYHYYSEELLPSFDLEVIPDPEEVKGTEQTLAYGTQKLFDEGCDYVTWMGDDALFHPQWHIKLRELIATKPNALSWSVYRSSYTDVHQTIVEEGDFVKVSSICGHGMTFSKEEWKTWGIDWRTGQWISPYGDTLDMFHIHCRQGDRWTTKVSYVDHTGKHGIHCRPEIPEYAYQFQGC